jgi:hypothetical protein
MADRKISDLTALTTPASGDYLPIVDISESAAASKNKRITIEELMRGAPDGTAAAPSIAFESDPNTGIYSPGADQLAISTNGTGRLFVDATGTVSRIGSDSTVYSNTGSTRPVGPQITIENTSALDNTSSVLSLNAINTGGFNSTSWIANIATPEAEGDFGRGGTMIFGRRSGNNNLESFRITRLGRLGIGTTAPGGALDIKAAAATVPLIVQGSSSEFARIDSSGRLLVGTSSARTNLFNGLFGAAFQVEGATSATRTISVFGNSADQFGAGILVLGASRGTAPSSNVILQNNDEIALISFQGSDGTDPVAAAEIRVFVDGTPGTNDMPGRLVFGTTADGASSPTERMRITSAGVLQVADAGDIAVGTTTGTKIGTATTQKLGFYDKTPVVQPIAVADATDAASAITQLNALLARMRDLGLIAT